MMVRGASRGGSVRVSLTGREAVALVRGDMRVLARIQQNIREVLEKRGKEELSALDSS